ncbi:cidABC operon transcriptional activator CidR [Paenibacillus xerothermodurans]|uniref:LysR family transcriptional regulator n=1 Tax=Paenibacillus xerothermodurans TaxID=1977292 RepID=A0A2W1NCE6_PAEXE|nr:LysR family transcriptional regulator [Paenibacillus xerothermodurans]PZE20731.1 LysR family transcriptional regulator [Paenibacillus xerothermodurans]
MDIRHMQYVVEVARFGSFTKAAEALHITQPTISKMVKNLEDELGVEVFIRHGKKVELTDAGHVIMQHAQHISNSFENLTSELNDLTHFRKGRIRIGLPPMAGANFFPGVMSRFREQYPGLIIQLVEDGSKKIEAQVASGALDMGVVLLPANAQVFESFPFVYESLQLLVHPSHPLAGRKEAALSELSEDAFILFREDFALHDRIIAECIRAGFKPRVLYESSQWDFISEMVAANLGVAMLPETICATLDPERVCVLSLVDPIIPWQLAMIWRKDGYLSFAAREWIRFTKGMLADRHNAAVDTR